MKGVTLGKHAVTLIGRGAQHDIVRAIQTCDGIVEGAAEQPVDGIRRRL
jgi:hypothetical protein